MTSKGCIPVMSLVLLITMVMSFAGRGCSGQQGQNGPQAEGSQVIATVGPFSIDARVIQAAYERAVQSMGAPPKAKDEATYFGILLTQQINSGLALIEAQRKSVPIGDADMRKDATSQIDQKLMGERIQLMQQGKLKGSSDKELDDAFKAATGKTAAQWRKEQVDAVNVALKDPVSRAGIAANLAETQVPKVLAAHLKPSDAELKASYQSLSVKQVLLNGPDVAGQIAKVQADLKSGATFEAVIDRYSKDKPAPGKKLSEIEAPITSDQLADDTYAPLRTLKAGDVSPVIVTPNGSVIYKILKVKDDLPKDFAKNKETLRTQLATKLGDAQFKKDLKELGKSTPITWKDPGWHALYDYTQASTDLTLKPNKKQAKLKAVIDEAKKAGHSQPAALAFYAAVSDLKNDLTGKPDPEFTATRIEAIQAVSEFAPGPDLDLELADIYALKKDGADLGEALAKAAGENNDFSPNGQATYVNIQVKEQLNSALLSADAKKQIADAQANWKQQSEEQKKEQADAAKADADRAKQDAADKKKFEADQKAEAAKAKSASAGPQAPPAPKQPPTSKK